MEASPAAKKKRYSKTIESSSDSSSDSDDEPDNEEKIEKDAGADPQYHIPRKGKRIWDTKQMANLRKNFKNIEHLEHREHQLSFLSGTFLPMKGKKTSKTNS